MPRGGADPGLATLRHWGGKREEVLSQAEKKRIADEKKALKAAEMEQARKSAREQHQKASLAPLWLVQAKENFQSQTFKKISFKTI